MCLSDGYINTYSITASLIHSLNRMNPKDFDDLHFLRFSILSHCFVFWAVAILLRSYTSTYYTIMQAKGLHRSHTEQPKSNRQQYQIILEDKKLQQYTINC